MTPPCAGARGPLDPPAGVRRLVRHQPLRAVPHAVPGNSVVTDGVLVPLSQPRPRRDGWNGPIGPQPRELRAGSPATLIRDLERIWDVPGARSSTRNRRPARSRDPHRALRGLPDAGTRRRRIGDLRPVEMPWRREQGRAPGRGRGRPDDRQPAERVVTVPVRPRLSGNSSNSSARHWARPTTGPVAAPPGSSPPTSATSRRRRPWPTRCSTGSTIPTRSSPCRPSRGSGGGGTGRPISA